MPRFIHRLLDTGPMVVLAAIAGAGSFTHIRDTAHDNGQTGAMSYAIAVCIDLTCVMAARERQRDAKTGRTKRGLVSWPVLVLSGGIVLSLAANLQQAEPTLWGRITAATPAGAFLIAVSMLERCATASRTETPRDVPQTSPATAETSGPSSATPAEGPNGGPAPDPALIDYARRVADDHQAKNGKPITSDLLRARLGVSDHLATDLLRALRRAPNS
ncbi:DUF2637 domain-containing protein [Spongiactinospora sp. 9N601]|uniref:DUF2637 domain-containing protein n=1 Tax=Spongiactinospora sp. 9N601 TaxID=3375149 RepID=UPI00378F4B78